MRINVDELSQFSRLSDELRDSYLVSMHKHPTWSHQQLMAKVIIVDELRRETFSEDEFLIF